MKRALILVVMLLVAAPTWTQQPKVVDGHVTTGAGALAATKLPEQEHRWASDLVKQGAGKNCRWIVGPASLTKECGVNVGGDLYFLEYVPPPVARSSQTWTLDWCVLHGETRVLHTVNK